MPNAHSIVPDSGYENLFTTSDSSFDATRLTFKMHAGGSYVPFTAANPGTVYVPADGTVVRYYDEKEKEQTCKWLAKMVDGAGLLLFSSQSDAQVYIRTGDVTKSLQYFKAGNFTTPAIPKFNSVPVKSEREMEEEVSLAALKTLTLDSSLMSVVSKVLKDLARRPTGSLGDPVKVVSEDPVVEALARALAEDPPGLPPP